MVINSFYFNIVLAYYYDKNNMEATIYIKKAISKLKDNNNNISIIHLIISYFLFEKMKIEDIIKFIIYYKDIIIENDYYFQSIIENFTDNNKLENFYNLWVYQYILLELLKVKNYYENGSDNIIEFSHYTSKNVFGKLINYEEKNEVCNPKENLKAYLRLTSITKTNDPEEGEILKSCICRNINKDIDTNLNKLDKDYLVFQTSFTRYTNSLTMFRLYGKENGEEGTGICLVFNRSFFGEVKHILTAPSQFLNNKNSEYKNNANEDKNNEYLPLYFVLYYDKEKNELIYNPTNSVYKNKCIKLDELGNVKEFKYGNTINDTVDNIRFIFNKIFDILRNIKNNEELIMAYKLLINIRYLIKHSAFFEEQEFRFIQLTSITNNSNVLLDKDISRLYSEYKIPIFHKGYLKKVIIGPKVKEASLLKEAYEYLINKNNKNINIEISDLPLN